MSRRLSARQTVAVWAVVIAVALGLRYIGVKANEAGRGGLALAVVLGVIALVLLILMIPVIREMGDFARNYPFRRLSLPLFSSLPPSDAIPHR